ncbi:MAG: hypothetical protein GY874_03650 [Desulfobacteraceae bacterium]|nr:hypothetical protein [Desulfobacteraceae bacterium]
MKLFRLLIAIISLNCFFQSHLFADTYAYLPNDDDDGSVTLVECTDENVIRTELESDTYTGPYYGVAVMPDNSYTLLTIYEENLVIKIKSVFFGDDSNDPSATFELDDGAGPRGVAIDTDGEYAYVTNYDADSVSKIDLDSSDVDSDTIDVGENPWGIVAYYDDNEDENYVYVANYSDGTVTVITDDFDDDFDDVEKDEITVGSNPLGIAITPDGSYVYVANFGSDTVSVIQTSDNSVIKTITVGDGPYGVAIGSDGDYVYVTNSEESPGRVDVISTSSNTVTAQYDVGDSPMGVSAPKNGDFAYVVNQDDDDDSIYYITEINLSDDSASDLTYDFDDDDSDYTSLIYQVDAIGVFFGGDVPDEPYSLSAEASSYDEIELTWEDDSDDELGFKIERSTDEDTGYTQIALVDEDTTSYTDTDVEGDTTYYYRIRAYSEAADSDYSDEASATTEDGYFSWCFIGQLLK